MNPHKEESLKGMQGEYSAPAPMHDAGGSVTRKGATHFAAVLLSALVLIASPAFAGETRESTIMAGVLEHWPGTGCTLLHIPGFNYWYELRNYADFQVGDTVTVVASEFLTSECEGLYFSYLSDNQIAPWRGFDFGCGVLAIDPEYHCMQVRSDTYGVIAVLGGATGFSAGDTIHLFGALFLGQCAAIPECAGNYCVYLTRAAECDTPARRKSWGLLKSTYR
jgi:hypothetical protein